MAEKNETKAGTSVTKAPAQVIEPGGGPTNPYESEMKGFSEDLGDIAEELTKLVEKASPGSIHTDLGSALGSILDAKRRMDNNLPEQELSKDQ